MHARVTRLEASADLLDEMTRQFEAHTVPVLEGLDGYKGYHLLGDRTNGVAMAVTYWGQSPPCRPARTQSRRSASGRRSAAAAASGPTVERYEVVSSS